MATKIIDNRQKHTKSFDELYEGEMFFSEGSNVLRMKLYDVRGDDEEVIVNTVDLDDGVTSYTPISERVIPVNTTITIE